MYINVISPWTIMNHHLQHALITTFSLLWSPPSGFSEHCLQHSLITIFRMLWSPPSAWRRCSKWAEGNAHSELKVVLRVCRRRWSALWRCMLWSPPSAWRRCSKWAEGNAQSELKVVLRVCRRRWSALWIMSHLKAVISTLKAVISKKKPSLLGLLSEPKMHEPGTAVPQN